MREQTIYVTRGLPASGKSTWAKQMTADNELIKEVNKDTIRSMLDPNGRHSKNFERVVINIRDIIIEQLIESGYDVIVSDTNLNPVHLSSIEKLAEHYREWELFNVHVEVVDTFLSVPVEECIRRDSERENPVGAKVIESMVQQLAKHKLPIIREL